MKVIKEKWKERKKKLIELLQDSPGYAEECLDEAFLAGYQKADNYGKK